MNKGNTVCILLNVRFLIALFEDQRDICNTFPV